MIAIPLDGNNTTTISQLYGNAPYFALLDSVTGAVRVVENVECGNGPKSADFLCDLGVMATIFFHMGEGVYKAFEKNDIEVFSCEKLSYSIEEIYRKILNNSLIKLDSSNYKELLDPGTTQECKCGCEE